jgi:serine/threonine protein kinase
LKVTDFGIARALASIQPGEASRVVWGSPQYFSPEQAAGEPPSPASDVYSMGVVMYQMFTGQLPFIGKTSRELARMHRFAEPIPPSELNTFLPPQLDEVILKVLSKEPSARYRTADQLGRVLQMIYERQKSTTAESVEAFPREPYAYQTGDTYLAPDAAPALSPIDWVAVILGMAALTAWGGLIPFFLWVFNRIR